MTKPARRDDADVARRCRCGAVMVAGAKHLPPSIGASILSNEIP
jgi:hypothetical protein